MQALTPADWAVNLLLLQGLLGAVDTIAHHEVMVGLPQRQSAVQELRIHAVRAVLYGVLFAAIANFQFHGFWTLAIAGLVLVEVLLTLWDFVVEDGSRKLPASERVLHTVLAINGGAVFALFGWQLVDWSAQPSAVALVSYGWRSWVLNLFAVGVAASGIRDAIAAVRLRRRAQPGNPFVGKPHQRVLVTGGTGFIGETLVCQLLDAGHEVTVLTRDPLRAAHLFGGRASCIRSVASMAPEQEFSAVINLAGAPVVGPRWSAGRQAALLASRVGTTQALMQWFATARRKPGVWIQASAIGAYGVRDSGELLHESSATGTGFMADLCLRWEAASQSAAIDGVRRVVLRLGLVFGAGGALQPLVMPFRFGFGGRLGSGAQVMSWIHRDDVIALLARALFDARMQGLYNAVAPEAVTQAEFASSVGAVLHRPVWFHLPAAPLRWLGGEMADLFLGGQRVVPARLIEEGVSFQYPALLPALRATL